MTERKQDEMNAIFMPGQKSAIRNRSSWHVCAVTIDLSPLP
jgi:hypothetical protein